ncbi:Kelch repeat-containing protein [Paenibacillus illinoisensis]|uniref:Kelch repeat-containing protein n=1 Tax=Paenibacillus illinoisensis TaxID=59845 RepID=UPI00301D84AA
MKKSLVLILSIIILFFGISTKSFAAESKDWVSVENLPSPRSGAALVSYDGAIYAFGGSSGSSETYTSTKNNNTYKYSPKSNEWTEMSPMPSKRAAAEAIEVGGKIYVIGGYYDSGSTLVMSKAVEIYDPKTDTWTTTTNMLTAKAWPAVSYINGFIYVFGGGSSPGVASNVVEKYDVTTGQWTKLKNAPQSLSASRATEVNGKIYLMGGTNYTNPTNKVWEYKFETDSYIELKSMGNQRMAFGLTSLDGKIYAIGDKNTEVYDPELNTWNPFISLNESRSQFAAISDKNNIYIVGGIVNSKITDSVLTIGTVSNETPSEPVDGNNPIDPVETNGDRAILVVTMTTGLEKEYDLPMSDVNAFLNWYDARDAGSGPAKFAINKYSNNKGPFAKRTDYVIFDKILTFEVSEYTTN